jgi:hypothetical protein
VRSEQRGHWPVYGHGLDHNQNFGPTKLNRNRRGPFARPTKKPRARREGLERGDRRAGAGAPRLRAQQ